MAESAPVESRAPPSTDLLRVRVAGPDGAPVSERLLSAVSWGTGGAASYVEDGMVEFRGAGPGPVTVFVSGGTHAAAVERVEVAEGKVTDFSIRLAPGWSISGRVADGTGRGVEGVRMTATPDLGVALLPFLTRRAASGKDGSFEFRGLRAGPHVLTVKDGHVRHLAPVTAPAADLLVPAAGSLRFRIAPPPGSPPSSGGEGIEVHVRAIHSPSWDLAGRSGDGGNVAYDPSHGMLEVRRIRPGDVEVRFRATGFAPEVRRLHIPSGGEARLDDVVLRPGLTLTGRLVDPSGFPVPGIRIQFTPLDAPGPVLAGVDADGRFAIGGLDSGPGVLTAREPPGSVDRFAMICLPLTVEEVLGPFELVMEPGTALRVRVRTARGWPVREAIIAVRRRGEPESLRRPYRCAILDGPLPIRVLPGTWEVEVFSPSAPGLLARRTVEVRQGQDVPLEIRLDD